jgi:hypothetical protein
VQASISDASTSRSRLSDAARHPTWTHGRLVSRIVSGITRAELVRHGFAVFGRAPLAVFAAMTDDHVRDVARAELCGYWRWASRRPWMWLDPMIADLGLTSMARGRHAIRTGCLLTKTEAIGQSQAPAWLVDQLRARRRGEHVISPRVRTGWIARRDARRTVRTACCTALRVSQEPEIEGCENEDNPDVHRQARPEVLPEE